MIEGQKQTGFTKAAQYAEEVLAGKYTLASLKGQIPDSWIDQVKQNIEKQGYLIIEEKGNQRKDDLPAQNFTSTSNTESTKNTQALNKIRDEAKIEEIRARLLNTETKTEKFETKAYEKNDTQEYKDGVNIYNGFVDVANAASQAFKDNSLEKVVKYGQEILNGQPKEKVLYGLGNTMVAAVEQYVKDNSVIDIEEEDAYEVPIA